MNGYLSQFMYINCIKIVTITIKIVMVEAQAASPM